MTICAVYGCQTISKLGNDGTDRPLTSREINGDYEVAVDSIVLRYTDDTTNSVTLHKGDIIHVDSTVGDGTFIAHVDANRVIISREAVRKYSAGTDTSLRPSATGTSATGSGHTIHTGPRGGQYYINANGKKTYVRGKKK
ncbi:MAG TPA: hypothetical protein DIS79_07960 [Bacteroidetes bacterium]|nr:hypothetical protein [Bacteroidota bacterium]